MKMNRIVVATLLITPLALSACKKKASGDPAGGDGGFAVPVVAVEAQRQPVSETLTLVGSIAANEMVEVKAETDGIVQDILFTEGQAVEKGQLLLRLDEAKFAAALAEAEGNFKLSQANYDRARQLFKDHLISQQEFDQSAATFDVSQATVELRRRDLKDARIYAPFSGIIGARFISPGQVISRTTLLSVLVDLDPVKVEVNVPERFLSQVRIGQELELSVAAFPGRKFRGKVFFIAPDVDPATRTALVKAEIPNDKHELKPGMFANLDLTLTVRDEAVVIPETALVFQQDKINVFVVGPDDTVQPREVAIGLRMPGKVEIIRGLQAGEKVVIEGTQKVTPGGKVKIVNS